MWKNIRREFQYCLIRLVIFILRLPSRTVAFSLAEIFGYLAFFILKKEREKTLSNLTKIWGRENSFLEIRKIAIRVFVDLGKNFVDALRIPRLNVQNIHSLVEIKGKKYFDRAYQKGKGVIAITAHLGCWELIPVYFALQGYKINVIGRRLYDERLNQLLTNLRKSKGVRNLERANSIRPALRILRRGEALGVLIDQDTEVEGVFVNFFSQPTFTPAGPILMAYRTQAAIVPLAIYRLQNNKHLIEVRKSLKLSNSREIKEEVFIQTQKCSKILEEFIREHPTQWVWMHERWKTKPPSADK
ncbi:MAG: lysophospholipid acyltransferase family protein [Candidatus Edwardsbacteria bacterium]